jgi:hypothetical protein
MVIVKVVMRENQLSKKILIGMFAISLLLVGCSSSDSKVSKKDKLDFGTKVTTVPKNGDGGSAVDSVSKIKSEDGAKTFAYKISSVFVSTDVKELSGLNKFISKQAKSNILSDLTSRNNSTILPTISYSPIGVTVDNYTNQKTSVAVLGISFISGAGGITSTYKEIRFDLVFDGNWKIESYILSDVDGVTGNGQILDPTVSSLLDGYVVPSDEFVQSDRKVINSSKVENVSKTTQYVAPGE